MKKNKGKGGKKQQEDSKVQDQEIKEQDISVVVNPLPLSEEELKPLCVYSLHLIKAIDLVAADIGGLSDPYCMKCAFFKRNCKLCF